MNELLDNHKILNDEEWFELSESFKEYNKYIYVQLSKIFEFDIWYEHSKSKEFPTEWYSMIRKSEAHK